MERIQGNNAGGVFFITEGQLEQYGIAVAKKVLESFTDPARNDFTSELLTVDDVAQRLHINRVTLWRWEREGYLKSKRIGRKKYYKLSDINRLAEQEEQGI